MEKNLNKIRTSHPVQKHIKFKDIKHVARFVNLYKDYFCVSQDDIRMNYIGYRVATLANGEARIGFKIKKSDWDEIQKFLKMKPDKDHWEYEYKKTRYWIYED